MRKENGKRIASVDLDIVGGVEGKRFGTMAESSRQTTLPPRFSQL